MLYLELWKLSCKGLQTLQSYAWLHKAGFEPAKPKHVEARPFDQTLVLVYKAGFEPTKNLSSPFDHFGILVLTRGGI